MSAIILRFVGGDDNFVSRAIRADSGGFWCVHVETLSPEGTLIGAHLDGGVQARARDYDAGTFSREEYVTIPATDTEAAAFYAFIRSQVGKPYDLAVIAALAASDIVGPRDWREPDSWICSEVIAAALEAAGTIPKVVIDINHLTPRDDRLILSALGH